MIHTLAVALSPLTLYPPRLLTTHVNVASRPCAIVTFSSGTRKSGSKQLTATHAKQQRPKGPVSPALAPGPQTNTTPPRPLPLSTKWIHQKVGLLSPDVAIDPFPISKNSHPRTLPREVFSSETQSLLPNIWGLEIIQFGSIRHITKSYIFARTNIHRLELRPVAVAIVYQYCFALLRSLSQQQISAIVIICSYHYYHFCLQIIIIGSTQIWQISQQSSSNHVLRAPTDISFIRTRNLPVTFYTRYP